MQNANITERKNKQNLKTKADHGLRLLSHDQLVHAEIENNSIYNFSDYFQGLLDQNINNSQNTTFSMQDTDEGKTNLENTDKLLKRRVDHKVIYEPNLHSEAVNFYKELNLKKDSNIKLCRMNLASTVYDSRVDCLTILKAHSNSFGKNNYYKNPTLLCKKYFIKNGKIDFTAGRGYYFAAEQKRINSIEEMHALLLELKDHVTSALIGGIADDECILKTRRQLKKNGGPFYEIEGGSRILIIDSDDHIPQNYEFSYTEEGVIDFFDNYLLPDFLELENVSYAYQFSASAGVFNPITGQRHTEKLKCHIFILLEQPLTYEQRKNYFSKDYIDQSVFNPVQMIYTAKPAFKQGLETLVTKREGLVLKEKERMPVDYTKIPAKTEKESAKNTKRAKKSKKKKYSEAVNARIVKSLITKLQELDAFSREKEECIDLSYPSEENSKNSYCIYKDNLSIVKMHGENLEKHPLGQWLKDKNNATDEDIKEIKEILYPDTPPYYQIEDEIDIEDFKGTATKLIDDFIQIAKDTDKKLALKLTTGSGKSSAARAVMAKYPEYRFLYFVPTIELAEEQKAAMDKDDKVKSMVRKGRSQPGMCHQYEANKAVYDLMTKVGDSVYASWCKDCVFRPNCNYINQFQEQKDCNVIFLPHSCLALDQYKEKDMSIDNIDFVIIDESFWEKLIKSEEKRQKITQKSLNSYVTDNEVRLSYDEAICLSAISGLFTTGKPFLKHLYDEGVTREILIQAAEDNKKHYRGTTLPSNLEDDPELKELILYNRDNLKPETSFSPLFSALAKEIELLEKRQECYCLELVEGDDSDYLSFHEKLEIKFFKDLPILVLDADADREILEAFFHSDVEQKEVRVKSKANITQMYSKAISNTALKENRDNIRELIADYIEKLSKTHEQILLVTIKAIEKEMKRLTSHIDGVQVEHFNNIRGKDGYKDFPCCVILGRNELPCKTIEDIARTIYYDFPREIQFSDENNLKEEPRGYRLHHEAKMKNKEVKVRCHQDPLCSSILYQKREAETMQSIARLRDVWKEKDVHIFSNVVLPAPVKKFISMKDLTDRMGDKRIDKVINKISDHNNVIPFDYEYISKHFDEDFSTAKSVEGYVKREFGNKKKATEYVKENYECKIYQFKPLSSPNWSPAFSLIDEEKTKDQLESIYNQPLNIRVS